MEKGSPPQDSLNPMNCKVAIVQLAPVHLNLPACMSKAKDAILDASKNGAKIIVFGETWFSGYPAWLDYCSDVAYWNHPSLKKVFARMLDNSMRRDSKEMEDLCKTAKDHKVSLVFGANEVDPVSAKGSIYNAIFFINERGELVNHHRKLVPTFTEKLLYTHGDGNGLRSSTLSGTAFTGAVCWEHWMPLTRQSLHDTGEEIHLAAWPKVHEMHQVASRQYAFEGRCYVLAAGQMFNAKNTPPELEVATDLVAEDQWILNGGSCIIGPDGFYVVEPVWDVETIIYADLDLDKVKEESLNLDVSGHYQRKDIFSLDINKERKG